VPGGCDPPRQMSGAIFSLAKGRRTTAPSSQRFPLDSLLRLRHSRISIVSETKLPAIARSTAVLAPITTIMITRLYSAASLALVASALQVSALLVPFTEDFAANNANWLTGASSNAPWFSSGGADGGGYISSTATMTSSGFGAALFRGNAASDASGDAFVGNWLTGGVNLFTTFIKHDAGFSLDIFARLDAGAGSAASTVFFSVPTGQWFEISVPIVDSASSFQSYGAAGPTGFNTVFANIQNVQFFASTNSPAGTYNFSLDNVSVVPEPRTVGLLGLGAALLGWRVCRRRRRGIDPIQ